MPAWLDLIRRSAGARPGDCERFRACVRPSERLGITLGVTATLYVVGGVVVAGLVGAVGARVRTRRSAVPSAA